MRLTRKRLDHANSGERFLHRYYHLRHAGLFVLHRLSGAFAVNANWQQTQRKENQRHHCKLPIHHQQHSDCADNGDRLLKDIAADGLQSHLHDASIVRDKRHQKPGTRLVKKIHRVTNHLAEKLVPDITHDPVAHPLHAISASERTETADSHDRRDGEADQDDGIDFWAAVENSKIMPHGHRIGSGATENGARHPSNRQREKGIDAAVGQTQGQTHDKASLVRLHITVEPPVRTRGCT